MLLGLIQVTLFSRPPVQTICNKKWSKIRGILFNISSQESLKVILNALSNYFEDIGYCQGMNFLVAAFVIYMNDEVFIIIWE